MPQEQETEQRQSFPSRGTLYMWVILAVFLAATFFVSVSLVNSVSPIAIHDILSPHSLKANVIVVLSYCLPYALGAAIWSLWRSTLQIARTRLSEAWSIAAIFLNITISLFVASIFIPFDLAIAYWPGIPRSEDLTIPPAVASILSPLLVLTGGLVGRWVSQIVYGLEVRTYLKGAISSVLRISLILVCLGLIWVLFGFVFALSGLSGVVMCVVGIFLIFVAVQMKLRQARLFGRSGDDAKVHPSNTTT